MSDQFGPKTLIPGFGLEGYPDKVSARGGESISLMLGGPPTSANLKVVRLIQGDPNPAGPGYKEEECDWGHPTSVEISEQFVDYGSCVEVPPADVLNPTGSFTIAFWYYPTYLRQGWNTLVSKWLPDALSFGIFGAEKTLCAALSQDGRTVEWITGMEVISLGCWQFVALTYEPESGETCFYQHFRPGGAGARHRWTPNEDLAVWRQCLSPGKIFPGDAPLVWGATYEVRDGIRHHTAHLNGKLGRPMILDTALDLSSIEVLKAGADPTTLAPVLGHWDFSQQVNGKKVVDVSGHENHGITVNSPGRAVTGPGWDKSEWYVREGSYARKPEDYDAVHFHEDDLEDAQWQPTVTLDVPADAKSGIYAARVQNGADEVYLPFVIRPKRSRCDLGFLVPTLTWLAYAVNRLPYSYTLDGVLDGGVCQYSTHRDGSMPYYVTRMRPTRTGNPSLGFERQGAHKITSNLYMIDWMEHVGFDYEVFADEDLHAEGVDLLAQYRCVVLGSHPEYWTAEMLDALVRYLSNGGRALYLGGNGLYWVTSLDSSGNVMEVRKEDGGDYNPPVVRPRGEAQHSSSEALGGEWTRRGRSPRGIVGVSYTANVWNSGVGRFGFERLHESSSDEYSFVFDGVDSDLIGDYGLNLGSAAANEMDSATPLYDFIGRPAPVVLARARHDEYFNGGPELPAGDMLILEYAGGGAVFSAASVTWTGSLSHNRYQNDVSRITENVIRRFVEAPVGESIAQSVHGDDRRTQ
jgi:N,N-dimethylformamidase